MHHNTEAKSLTFWRGSEVSQVNIYPCVVFLRAPPTDPQHYIPRILVLAITAPYQVSYPEFVYLYSKLNARS